jgi:tetratricopeptide (TPR) repeat protein
VTEELHEVGPPAWRRTLPSVLLIVAVAAAYLNSFHGAFLFDDVYHIIENERIRRVLPPWHLFAVERPLVEFSLAVNYALGGLNPWGYHAFNLAVHILATLTLFGLVRRMFIANAEWGIRNAERATAEPPHSEFRIHNSAFVFAFAVALLWAVHPLPTQSVTYVIQRGESLMGLFYLLTLYCAIRAAQSSRRSCWHGAAIAACALGMASKAVMVTAPVMVVVYDLVLSRHVGRAAQRNPRETERHPVASAPGSDGPPFDVSLRRRWGLYFGLAVTWGVLWACGVTGAVLDPMAQRSHVGLGYHGATPLAYLATQAGVVVHYLRLSLWPVGLCLDYDWPVASTLGAVVPPGLVIIALLLVTAWGLIRRSWLGFAGAWFFLILAPTSSFIPIKDPAFEHRMYLPLAGLIAVVVIGGDVVLKRIFGHLSFSARLGRVIQGAIVGVTALLLGYGTVQRNEDYRSELAMWADVAGKRPHNARARVALGNALLARNRVAEAVAAYREAVGIRPDFADAQCALGMGLAKKGSVDEAVAAYREALRLDPNHPQAHYNLANALARQGRTDEAIDGYRKSLRIQPQFADAHCNLGNALAKQERWDEAIGEYREALRLNPKLANGHNNLGEALRQVGSPGAPGDEAIASYREAIRLQPDYANAHANLAAALLDRGDYDEALEHAQEALRIDPGHVAARETLSAVQDAISARRRP